MDHSVDERETLAGAQRALLRNRREAGLPVGGASQPLPDVGAAVRRELVAVRERYGAGRCGRCGAAVEHPGICAGCAHLVAEAELREASGVAIEREIPERFRWARWDAPELAQRVAGGAAKVASARAALASGAPVVVLVGPGRKGKSSIAAAWLRGGLGAGHLGARWVAARHLGDEQAPEGRGLPYDRALSAEELVLDDMGAELAGAPKESGLIAQRAEPAIRLISERYDRGVNGRFVVTTPIGAEVPESSGQGAALRRAMAAVYGDGVAGRIYEHAAVVRIGGGA